MRQNSIMKLMMTLLTVLEVRHSAAMNQHYLHPNIQYLRELMYFMLIVKKM